MLKIIYKYLINQLFFLIHGKITIGKVQLNKIKVHGKEFKFGNNNYNVYRIKKARIFTNNVENFSIIKNNYLVPEGSFQQINGKLVNYKKNITLKIGTPGLIRKFNGTTLNLAQAAIGHNNYCHWLVDILPKIMLFSQVMDLKKIDFFYFSKLTKFQIQTLNILRIVLPELQTYNKIYLLLSNFFQNF